MCEAEVEREMDSANSTSPIANTKERGVHIFESQSSNSRKKQPNKRVMIMCILLAIGGITCGVIGVVYFERAKQLSSDAENQHASQKTEPDTGESGKLKNRGPCALSEEVQNSGLIIFFNKVEEVFFKYHPHEVPYKYGVTRKEVIKNFHGYNPNPAIVKEISDQAKSLLEELKKLKLRKELLKLREAKVLIQTEHFLEHNFGNAYDNGYYTGEWLLGPNRFCYMQPMARLQFSLKAFYVRLQPRTLQDMETIIKVLKGMGTGINQYQKNLEMGVRVGMVNSVEECIAGYECLVDKFPYIGSFPSNENMILSESFVVWLVHPEVIEKQFANATKPWREKYGKSLGRSLTEAVLENLGKPLAQLFRYLSGEYRSHCVPSNVSSGLATRPVPYVYTNGVANLHKPTETLPTGEKANGKKAYERILGYFTTTNSTPDEVNAMGWKILKSLYPQVIEIAKSVTNEQDEQLAVSSFRKYINTSEMFFNEEPFPANESDETAYKMCKTMTAAKINCPVRYETLQKWFMYSRSTLSMLRPRLLNMFHWLVGPKKTTPICPVIMVANFQPSSGSQSYHSSESKCRIPAKFRIPFFLDRMGPKYSEWTVNAHEALPGHHLQIQGRAENFDSKDKCEPLLGALSRSKYSNEAFVEGWALYAEDPLIAKGSGIYNDEPLQKYGMLKWQIWRALRLIVDTGLHYKGMTRQEALQLFSKYAWDDSDVARKELTRYQSGPGQATAYMIGQRAILSMRNKATEKLGKMFNLKDFHYYVLSRGPAPLKFIGYQVDRYVDCELNKQGSGCENVLVNTTTSTAYSVTNQRLATFDDETLNPPEIQEQ